MNNLKRLTKILSGLYLLLSLNSCFLGGGDEGVDVIFLNNFSQPLVVEIWSGDKIKYVEGEVRGENLRNNLSLTTVTNVGADNETSVTIGDDQRRALVIIGTDEGANGYWYLADEVIDNLDSYSVTVEIEASGNITVY
ncbi:MAG: hypothetical protein ABUK01_07315 [Leptospirales bacterium]